MWHDSLVAKVLALNTLESHMGAGSYPSSSISLPAPCLWPGKAVKDSLGTLHLCGRPGRSSWLQTGSALVIVATWGVNHWTEDLPLCLSSSLYICLSNEINKSLKK